MEVEHEQDGRLSGGGIEGLPEGTSLEDDPEDGGPERPGLHVGSGDECPPATVEDLLHGPRALAVELLEGALDEWGQLGATARKQHRLEEGWNGG